MPIFLDDEDFRRFTFLLGEMVEEFDIQCWQHCLMTNHYHLALRSTRPNISEGLRHLNGTYAQWWNRKHGRPGHVFQGRFKDQIVQQERYLLTLCRYIAMNPVRAGMVEHPADWQWSSYRATAGLAASSGFLTLAPVLAQFGDDEPHALHMRFAQHVLQEHPDYQAAMDRFRSNERIIGDKAFKTYVRIEMGEIVEPGSAPSVAPAAACA